MADTKTDAGKSAAAKPKTTSKPKAAASKATAPKAGSKAAAAKTAAPKAATKSAAPKTPTKAAAPPKQPN